MMKTYAILCCLFLSFLSNAQVAQDYFVSQAKTTSLGDDILISIKKYNPTEEEIKSAKNYKQGQPMNFLQVPFNATSLSFFDKSLESILYCIDNTGKIKWKLSTGFSNYSEPSPVCVSDNFIYSGAGEQKQSKITIQKINSEGKIVWQTEIDSVENVNDIYAQEGIVAALISFDHSEKIKQNDGSFSLHTFPVYFFVELNAVDGKLKSKEYQTDGTYFSQLGYDHPLINSTYSYYLNNPDSVIFFMVPNKNILVTSNKMSRDHKVLDVAATEESNHYLTALSKNGLTKYAMISDFYGNNKNHYESEIDLKADTEDRHFIHLLQDTSVLAAIASKSNTYIYAVNNKGEAKKLKTFSYGGNTVIATIGSVATKPYVITVSAPSLTGSIRSLDMKF